MRRPCSRPLSGPGCRSIGDAPFLAPATYPYEDSSDSQTPRPRYRGRSEGERSLGSSSRATSRHEVLVTAAQQVAESHRYDPRVEGADAVLRQATAQRAEVYAAPNLLEAVRLAAAVFPFSRWRRGGVRLVEVLG